MTYGFRITKVKIGNQSYPISEKTIEKIEKNFFTVIIGNNATGKSRFLVNLLNLLRQQFNPRIKTSNEDYEIEYIFKNKLYSLSKENPNLSHDIGKMNLLSISNSIFDKFPHNVKSDINYSYVGVRTQGINTHKRAIINDLMDVFNENLEEVSFVIKAKQLLEFLKIEPIIRISLRKSFNSNYERYSELINYSKTNESLQLYLKDLSNRGFYRQQSNVLEKYANDIFFLDGFVQFIKKNKSILENPERNSQAFDYEINLNNSGQSTTNEKFVSEFRFISLLRRLNLLTYDSILLKKGNSQFDIQDSSTGEIGLLMTFIRAIPELKSNSIIFIDEPEISLHPSWQMRYIELLKKFLSGHTGCHVFIATHSHFILSDLKENFSSIISLQNNSGILTANLKKYTPYGWSPEAILYEVFGVATTRNHFFEYDLRNLLSLISTRSNDISTISKHIDKLSEFDLAKGDPLHQILKEAKIYVKEKK